ncbi:MAG: amino acid ABC transporter permease [Nocardioidaceae bacterium]
MSGLLFDIPGPRARARHRIIGAVTALVLLALVGWAIWRLYQNDQFAYEKWEPFVTPAIVRDLFDGLLVTLEVAAVSIALAIPYGMLFAVGRLSDHAILRWPCFVVVEFFRAIPVLMMVFFLSIKYAAEIGKFWVIAIPLIVYNGSVLAEVFRAGILAVPTGQREAGSSIGLRKYQLMTIILIPQAVTAMLPAIISQCVVALKDTALAFVIPYDEIVSVGNEIRNEFHNSFATAIVLATVFIIINYSLSRLAIWLERRLARRGRTSAKVPTVAGVGVGDQSIGGPPTMGN